jgi:hypothetical protein
MAKFPWILVLTCLMPWISSADEADKAKLRQLEQELHIIKQGVEAHDRVLRALIERIKQGQNKSPRPAPKAQTEKPTKKKAVERKKAPPKSNNNTKPHAQTPTKAVPPAFAVPPALAKQAQSPAETTTSAEQTRPEKIGKPRMTKGQEVVRQEVNVLFEKRLVIEPGFRYSRIDRQQVSLSGFLALDSIFIGAISVDEVESDVLQFDLATRYGITDRLEIDFSAPFLYRNTTYRDTGAGSQEQSDEANVSLDFELGDISVGLSYQVLRETPPWPDIVWSVRIKAPTGSHPFGIKTVKDEGGNLVYPRKLSSGNGIWGASTGLSFVKSAAPAILFGSASYFHNFEESFDDISSESATVAPGTIKLGDSLSFGLGFAVAISEKMSFSTAYSQLISNETKTKVEGGEWSKIRGSDTNSAQLNFGVTYALSEHWSIVSNVGAGLTPDAPNVQISMKFPYAF